MPRPGPRPYECVRRAWHSDRHQPMRGSLIQEIFRMANDVHSPATRKNKEWQEKLPFVVLKAEEIMYSKANSEAEYMDLTTLQDRANDAIDTIIRKDDDATESGLLLQPCIEAALNLGCVPRRASRSQRHSNPGHYLSPIAKDVTAASLNVPGINRASIGNLLRITPPDGKMQSSPSQPPSWCSTFFRPADVISGIQQVNSNDSDTSCECKDCFAITKCGLPFSSKPPLFSCHESESIRMETWTSPSFGQVYPLFCDDNQPDVVSHQSFQIVDDARNHISASAMSCIQSLRQEDVGSMSNVIGSKTTIGSSKGNLIFVEKLDDTPNTRCDLSLRLGLPSLPSFHAECSWANEHEDARSSCYFD